MSRVNFYTKKFFYLVYCKNKYVLKFIKYKNFRSLINYLFRVKWQILINFIFLYSLAVYYIKKLYYVIKMDIIRFVLVLKVKWMYFVI